MKNVETEQPGGGARDDIAWRHFPEFEKILSNEAPSPLMTNVEKTCRQLNDVLQAGSENDKERARAAMTAYGRSLDLLRQLTEIRDKASQT